MARIVHVSIAGPDEADGSERRPLRTIDHAARVARPGDTVRIHEGTYREWVRPPRGGLSDLCRITYEAAPGEHVAIKGSERITGWERSSPAVWKAVVPNSLFGEFNPFAEEVAGDWVVHPSPDSPRKHLGDVYLDGLSLFEEVDLFGLEHPIRRDEVIDDWTGSVDRVRNPDQTELVWYAEVGEATTTIWANFQGADPNERLVEINVRPSVFSPIEHHIDYITVRGLELAHAASPWAPPTAAQVGLIGPNWAKGWVIEDNLIHDAKCVGVSLGKEGSTGHHFATTRMDKPGYQYQIEAVFSASRIGWDKEHIGSHVVRRNTISDCGQGGIVGHLGAVFSTIEDNHISNIAIRREFYGYEIAGIKLHAAIDVHIRHNRIHDCSLAIWLDWQSQGTRVSRNVLYANSRDLFVEVSNGPYVVEHNILGSGASLENFSQGGAFVNNLLCGTVSVEPVLERPTPYHVPHSTQVAGYAAIFGGDDRYVGNLFLSGNGRCAYGRTRRAGQVISYGTAAFDAHPPTLEEYLAEVAEPTIGDHERFEGVRPPVYVHDNAYGPGAHGYRAERNPTALAGPATATLVEEGDDVFLVTDLPEAFDHARVGLVTGVELPPVRLVGAHFEERDGSPLELDRDLTGVRKEAGPRYPMGPLVSLASGSARTRVWPTA